MTQKQWLDLMEGNPSHFKGDRDCPVEQVSWDDVHGFIQTLNKKADKTFQLPTEAEWEYAASGSSSVVRTKWPGTDNENELSNYAWYDCGKTRPVGTKKPNSFGIYDMCGNVWEWCTDWYSDKYYAECKTKGTVENPLEPNIGSGRIVRGGSCINFAEDCRTPKRLRSTHDNRFKNAGFRLVLPVK